MICKRVEDNLIICKNLKEAKKTIDRMIGLMFKEPMKDHDGLLIKPCNSIHTFFMKYSLDVVFLSKKLEVVAIYKNIKPWRMTRIIFKASQCLEMKNGTLTDDLRIGDKLELCIN